MYLYDYQSYKSHNFAPWHRFQIYRIHASLCGKTIFRQKDLYTTFRSSKITSFGTIFFRLSRPPIQCNPLPKPPESPRGEIQKPQQPPRDK